MLPDSAVMKLSALSVRPDGASRHLTSATPFISAGRCLQN